LLKGGQSHPLRAGPPAHGSPMSIADRGTLCVDTIRLPDDPGTSVDQLSIPTPLMPRVFQRLGVRLSTEIINATYPNIRCVQSDRTRGHPAQGRARTSARAVQVDQATRTPRPAAHKHDALGGRAGCAGGFA